MWTHYITLNPYFLSMVKGIRIHKYIMWAAVFLALQLNFSTCIQGNEIICQCSKCNDQRTRQWLISRAGRFREVTVSGGLTMLLAKKLYVIYESMTFFVGRALINSEFSYLNLQTILLTGNKFCRTLSSSGHTLDEGCWYSRSYTKSKAPETK